MMLWQGYWGPTFGSWILGAGAHKPFRSTVKSAHAEYFSMDIDPEGTFDFGSFEDVPPVAKFDLIIANQVLEHLTIDDAFALLNSAGSHMDQGASLGRYRPQHGSPGTPVGLHPYHSVACQRSLQPLAQRGPGGHFFGALHQIPIDSQPGETVDHQDSV